MKKNETVGKKKHKRKKKKEVKESSNTTSKLLPNQSKVETEIWKVKRPVQPKEKRERMKRVKTGKFSGLVNMSELKMQNELYKNNPTCAIYFPSGGSHKSLLAIVLEKDAQELAKGTPFFARVTQEEAKAAGIQSILVSCPSNEFLLAYTPPED